MLPHFNSHLYNPNNNQLQNNGTSASASQQVMGNPRNFCPNTMQIRSQFQLRLLNPQLAMPPLTNPNTYFAPTQLFPFPQSPIQNINSNNLPQIFAHNAVNPPQFLPNGQFNMPNLVQNVNQLLQMQIPNASLQNFANARLSVMNDNGIMRQSMNGNFSKQLNHNATVAKDFGAPQQQQNQNMFSPGAVKLQGYAGEVNGVNNSWRRSDKKNFNRNLKGDASQRGFVKQQFHHKQNAKGNFKFHNENRGKGYKYVGAKSFTLPDSSKQIQVGKKRSLMLNYTEQEIQQWREHRRKNYPSKANMEKKLRENSTQPAVTDAVAKIRRQQLKEILEKQAELGCEIAEIPYCYLSDSERQADCRGNNQKILGKRERFRNKFDKQGKFDQNGRFSTRQSHTNDSANLHDCKDRFAKKQRLANDRYFNPHMDNKKEPSLLQKLLSSDIERDKKHLLQVFRFMVMNSFFKNLPKEPMKFPVVIVKESGDESGIVEEKRQVVKGDTSASASASASASSAAASSDESDDGNNDEPDVFGKVSSRTDEVKRPARGGSNH